MAPPPPVVAAQPQSTSKTINIKILGVCAILLLAAMIYNSMGGGARFSYHGGRGAAVHEAALPLQKRPRKSKYDHGADPDSPDEVVVPGARRSWGPAWFRRETRSSRKVARGGREGSSPGARGSGA